LDKPRRGGGRGQVSEEEKSRKRKPEENIVLERDRYRKQGQGLVEIYILGFDFISLSEWVDEKEWRIWKERLPRSYI